MIKIEYLLEEIQLSRGNVIKFQCDSLEFLVVLSKNKQRVKSVNFIISHKDVSWSADFSKFRDGFSEKIELKSNKSDYLALKLNITKTE
jgi:hypothetical protein